MRMAIGLAAILITLGVIIWIMSAVTLPMTQQAISVKKKVEPQVLQMSGKGTDGTDARQSIGLDAENTGGKMTAVLVTALVAGGPMEEYFGLQKGDSIVEISPQNGAFMPVKEMGGSDEAKDQLLAAYQNSQQIIVNRNGQKITLPLPKPDKGKPAQQAPGSALQNQLDAIQKQAPAAPQE